MDYLWDSLKDDASTERELFVVDCTWCDLLEEVDEGEGEYLEEEDRAVEDWKRVGPGHYLLEEDVTDAGTSLDHVKEEDRMDLEFPRERNLEGRDRERLPQYNWVRTKQLQTLLALLPSQEDFIRLQVLCSLRDWLDGGNLKWFHDNPGLMDTLTGLLFRSELLAVKRLAAKVLAELAGDDQLRLQLVRDVQLTGRLLAVLNDPTTEHGSMTRGIIGNIFANATEDIGITDFIMRNLKVDVLFRSLQESTDWVFQANVLKLMRNILLHPLGYSVLTKMADLDLDVLLRGLESLVPVFQQRSFEVLDVILGVSRDPHRKRIHADFIKVNGVIRLVALLEETCLADSKIALNVMTLLDHMADGREGLHVLLCSGYGLLKSMAFSGSGGKRNKSPTGRSSLSRLIPGQLAESISHTAQADKYNSWNAAVCERYEPPEVPGYEVLPTSSVLDDLGSRKGIKNTQFSQESIISRVLRDSPGVRHCQRRVFWSLDRSRAHHDWSPRPMTYARLFLDSWQEPNQTVERNLRIMALELIARLAAHKQGGKVVCELVRYLCPLLTAHRENGSITESVAYCLQRLLGNSSSAAESLEPLLPRYYLVRELVTGLEVVYSELSMGALLGPLAQLLKASRTSAYCLTHFRIRPALNMWLKQSPEPAPARMCLNNLMVIYYASRQYKRRDYILCKSVVSSLFRLVQVGGLEEISRIFAICGLALLTFGNKRYKKLGALKYSAEDLELLTKPAVPGAEVDADEEAEFGTSGPAQGKIYYGPYPTACSFVGLLVDQQLFLQEGCRGTRSPSCFFVTFLINLLLQRSSKFWTPYYLKHHKQMMSWLGECYKEKQALAQDVYETIAHNIPSLSFYYEEMVRPWSKLDVGDFTVCVDGDPCGTFPEILPANEDLDSLYVRYKLSPTETATSLPWEIYWKDRYKQERNETFTPKMYPSVFPDSIFGLGGLYRDTTNGDEAFVVHSKRIKELTPQHKDKQVTYHPDTVGNTTMRKVASTFYRSTWPTTLKKSYIPKKEESNKSSKRIILPNLYRFMKQLFEGVPMCKITKPTNDYSFNKLYIFKSKISSNIEKRYLGKLQKFYKPRVKLFTKLQFELLVKSLKHPPLLWNLSTQKENTDGISSKQLNKLRQLLKYFPNSFLNKIEIPPFFIDKKRKPVLFKRSPYDEAACVVSTLVLESYETVSAKVFPWFGRRWKERKDHDLCWSGDHRFPSEDLRDFKWFKETATYGKVFLFALDHSSYGATLLRYRMPQDLYQRRRSASSLYTGSRRSRKSSTSLSSPKASRYKKSKQDVKKDGSQKKQQKSSSRISNINNLHLPTSTEVVMDLFFQPALPEMRGFHKTSQVGDKGPARNKSVLSDIAVTHESVLRALTERDIILLKRNIDYQHIEDKKANEALKTNENSQDSMEECTARPAKNPNFAEFCEYAKKGILDILKKVGVQCWYAEIIKFIAKIVCLRLEGPFGYVDDYIMRHHRQELKRLLGTSLIPFGRLRIGGELERAVLFKFLADLFAIPCGLQRRGPSGARVEVPKHPFLFPLRGTCFVDLRDRPGDLLQEGSQEAEEYEGYTLPRNQINLDLTNGQQLETHTYQDSFQNIITYIKSKENNIKDKLKNEILKYYSNFNESSTIDLKPETFLEFEDIKINDLPDCSYMLSKEHFQKSYIIDSEYISEESYQKMFEEDTINSTESDNYSALISNIGINENFINFSWKQSPDGMYCMLIGKVGDSSFTRPTVKSEIGATATADELGFNYTETTSEQLLQELSGGIGEPAAKHEAPAGSSNKLRTSQNKEEDKYFQKWEEILKDLLHTKDKSSSDV